MKNTKNIIIATTVALCLTLGVALFAISQSHQAQPTTSVRAGDVGRPIYTGIPSNTGILCGTASTAVVSTSTSRQYLEIRNQSNQTIWFSFGVPAATSTGVALTATSSPLIISPYTFMYTGVINCIAASAASSTVLEAK